MAFLHELGKLFGTVGNVVDAGPNKILGAFGLPDFTNPLHMFGDFLKDPKHFQFGREFGNNLKLGAIAAGAYFGIPALAHLAGLSGAASGGAATADVGTGAALPSGTTAAMGEIHGASGDLLADMWGQGSAVTAPSQGLIGGTGGAPGALGAAEKAGTSPGAGTKGMNPIMKSFLDNFIKERMQKQQWQPPNLMPMGRTGNPGRQHLPSLGGAWGTG